MKFILLDAKPHFFFKDGEPDHVAYNGVDLGSFTITKIEAGNPFEVDAKVSELVSKHKNVVACVDNGTDGAFYWTSCEVRHCSTGKFIQGFSETE